VPGKDPRIDAYIDRAGDFARPILKRIRRLIHAACPTVTETIKWRSPFYEHRGILAATPAFKKHCALILWKGRLVFNEVSPGDDPTNRLRRLADIRELPDNATLTRYFKKAVELNEAGARMPVPSRVKKSRPVRIPPDFQSALRNNPRARTAFAAFSPSRRREYVDWLLNAKREETRARRLKSAIEWIAQGKSVRWKYERC